MILDYFSLENFGAYAGLQEADLAPKKDRPVILFGGMNGGGKTTMLEAVQLAFYGPKARVASRGNLPYRDYLKQLINSSASTSDGASVTVRFRRIVDGQTRQYEIRRSWREGVEGIEESFTVRLDGENDELLTEHWPEYIESYLPVSIANLFFFDGEQIMELAEPKRASEILGTAIQSLLGLDIVERLDADLRALERRKRNETVSETLKDRLKSLNEELKRLDQDQEKASIELGKTTNDANTLARNIHALEDSFKKEGGELFLQREKYEAELKQLDQKKRASEDRLRLLAAGSAPLFMIRSGLQDLERSCREQLDIRRSRILVESLKERDEKLLAIIPKLLGPEVRKGKVAEWLSVDRKRRQEVASRRQVIDVDESFPEKVKYLRVTQLDEFNASISEGLVAFRKIEEQRDKIIGLLARVPTADAIAKTLAELDSARNAHHGKLLERTTIEAQITTIQRQKAVVESAIERLASESIDDQFAVEDRVRVLTHSERIRGTLGRFRSAVVSRHTIRLEELIFDCFKQLLRKKDLVQGLKIDPETFAVTLSGRGGKALPFTRLSAGERQLLATSFLWGMARASGRPMPSIIDTPLGRLDSSHRIHLVERYFPFASHQMLLLSTDQEIVGDFYDKLKPFISRTYTLRHNAERGNTEIVEGYFEK